ncbi:MAG: A/G-specific adenine glycosylase [Fuerstiella sp.]|nr:A/G-specific adenine glycosylase [Fuerstiella sp.]
MAVSKLIDSPEDVIQTGLQDVSMATFPNDLDHSWRQTVRRRVLAWYRVNGRSLPWRESADPYYIWISEIMLQQTTIAAVTAYFERFCKQFPTVQHLARAQETDVLRQWEGLGYYSRARNLHKAARIIVDEHAGELPDHVDGLLKLPGIGPYTARAIASLAYGHGVGILEANTIRVYSRLIGLDENPRSTSGSRTLWKFADWIVAPRSASSFNQGAMDVGSTICTPEDPSCSQCPLQNQCCSYKAGRQHELPRTPPKKKMTDVTEVALVLRRGSKILMRQYSEGERWAGLWDFVRFPVSIEQGNQLLLLPDLDTAGGATLFASESTSCVVQAVREHTGLLISDPYLVTQIRHTVTRFRIRLLCVMATRVHGSVDPTTGFRWQPQVRFDELPLSTTARAIAKLVSG